MARFYVPSFALYDDELDSYHALSHDDVEELKSSIRHSQKHLHEISPHQLMSYELENDTKQHIKALRLKSGDEMVLFNGDGKNYHGLYFKDTVNFFEQEEAHEHSFSKNSLKSKNTQSSLDYFILTFIEENKTDSPLYTILIQSLSINDKIDFIIQKGVELGLNEMYPINTERSQIRISKDRSDKKQPRYQQIANSASEQCGRSTLCKIHPIDEFKTTLSHVCERLSRFDAKRVFKVIMDPLSEKKLNQLIPQDTSLVKDAYSDSSDDPPIFAIAIGPEGGFSPQEINVLQKHGFQGIQLGPRILRTETAALTLLAALNALYGDFY